MSDGVRLPRLTREELAALGDRPILVDAEDRAWWDGLDDSRRAEITTTARHGLLARELARPDGDGLELDGRLKFILAVRSAPAWLASRPATRACVHTASTCPRGRSSSSSTAPCRASRTSSG